MLVCPGNFWYTTTMDRIAIKQVGGSLYFRVPAYFVRKHRIEAGDLFDLIVNADGSIIKLVKVDELEKVVPRQEASVAAE